MLAAQASQPVPDFESALHRHQAGLLAEPEHLHEQILQQLQVPAAELTDPCVVRLLVPAQ